MATFTVDASVRVDQNAQSVAPKLSRSPIKMEDTPRTQLAVKANELLGYSRLLRETCPVTQLGQVLQALGIEPLNAREVNAYQAWKRQQPVQPTIGNPSGFGKHIWKESNICAYLLPIPEFVLDTAVRIKEQLPEAQFFVEYLAYGGDPFLIVSHNNVRYYVEVWDEPKFEGEQWRRAVEPHYQPQSWSMPRD